MDEKSLLKKIAWALCGISYDDLSTAEQSVVKLLIEADYVKVGSSGIVTRNFLLTNE